ncbi:MAG: thermonuclease family protein [Lautropia sp.]|nr:thermonuclease family protein [Lautropia sp.]
MKKLPTLLLLSCLMPFAVSAKTIPCKVVGVADGDTLTCLTADKQSLKVRLNQIDAPERGQAFGQAARRKLAELVHGKSVRLETDGTDQYGRLIAQVFVDKRNINQAMVQSGHAWAYRKYLKDPAYLKLEADARAASRGLWSQPNAVYPSEYRRGKAPGEVSRQVLAPTKIKAGKHQNHQGHAHAGGGSKHQAAQGHAQPVALESFRCEGKRFCREMNSCAEARFYLTQCGVSRLDGDRDGKPCERLCF